jgi:hypothetical protein
MRPSDAYYYYAYFYAISAMPARAILAATPARRPCPPMLMPADDHGTRARCAEPAMVEAAGGYAAGGAKRFYTRGDA